MRVEELERRLGAALHAADTDRIDLAAGRAGIARRVAHRHALTRRLTLVAVAAAGVVIAIAVLVPTLLVGRGERDNAPIEPRPTQRISPSGLPVGILEMGDVTKFRGPGHDPVRLLVWPDGRGRFRVAPGFAPPEDWYEVQLVAVRPGTVALRYDSPVCTGPAVVLTMSFRLRPGRVDIVDAHAPGQCLISSLQATNMAGRTWKITPLPLRYRQGVPSAPFGRGL